MNNYLVKGTILHGRSYNYCIERTLGQGSFGITYLANIQVKGALGTLDGHVNVAIKEFFMKEINGRENSAITYSYQGGIWEKYREKFEKEAQNLSTLQHPNIIKVLELFQENNTVYYVMEYIEGGSLDLKVKKEGRFSEELALKFILQIGNALAYMHDHKMLHLDLKPSNVMLRPNGDVVLIDFGLSKQFNEDGEPESSTTIGGGTPGYAPLEQCYYHAGKGFPTTMDVYALGATLYKMLTGEQPPIASEILNYGFPKSSLLKSGISTLTVDVIQRAMSAMKNERYPSVREFLMSLGCCHHRERKDSFSDSEQTVYNKTHKSTKGEKTIDEDPTTEVSHWMPSVNCFYLKDNYLIAILGGLLYRIPFEERFLIYTQNGVLLNSSALDGLKEPGIPVTKWLLHCCQEEIRASSSFIMTYSSDTPFFDALMFFKLFLNKDSDRYCRGKLMNEIHLSAFASALSMSNEDNIVLVSTEKESCLCETGEGVIELLPNALLNDYESHRDIALLDGGRKECVEGAFFRFSIYKDIMIRYAMLDAFPYSISCGMLENNQEIIIEPDTTIPCLKCIEILKGYAPSLVLMIADHSFELALDSPLHNENTVMISIEIGNSLHHISIKISSLNSSYEQRFILTGLL